MAKYIKKRMGKAGTRCFRVTKNGKKMVKGSFCGIKKKTTRRKKRR